MRMSCEAVLGCAMETPALGASPVTHVQSHCQAPGPSHCSGVGHVGTAPLGGCTLNGGAVSEPYRIYACLCSAPPPCDLTSAMDPSCVGDALAFKLSNWCASGQDT